MAGASSDDDAYPSEWWGAQNKVVAPHGAKESPHDSVTAVAQYLADMTAQLESMAVAANLQLIAYLLAMARSEADSVARTHPGGANGQPG